MESTFAPAAFATYALVTGAEGVRVGSKLGAREVNPGPEAPATGLA